MVRHKAVPVVLINNRAVFLVTSRTSKFFNELALRGAFEGGSIFVRIVLAFELASIFIFSLRDVRTIKDTAGDATLSAGNHQSGTRESEI